MLPLRLYFAAGGIALHLVATSGPVLGQSSTRTTLRNPPTDTDTALLITLGVGDRLKTRWECSVEIENGEREYLMGEEGRVSSPPRFRVQVEGTAPIGEVEIVKDSKMVYSNQPGTQRVEFEYCDNPTPGEEASFSYLRVRQSGCDRRIGWSSPIRVSR